MEIFDSPVLTRPTNSSQSLGLLPTLEIGVGDPISSGMNPPAPLLYHQTRAVARQGRHK